MCIARDRYICYISVRVCGDDLSVKSNNRRVVSEENPTATNRKRVVWFVCFTWKHKTRRSASRKNKTHRSRERERMQYFRFAFVGVRVDALDYYRRLR